MRHALDTASKSFFLFPHILACKSSSNLFPLSPGLPQVGFTYPFVERRQRLPVPAEVEKSVSLWHIIKDCVGKDISRITLPVYFNEPISTLQKCCEELEYSWLLDRAYEYGKRVRRGRGGGWRRGEGEGELKGDCLVWRHSGGYVTTLFLTSPVRQRDPAIVGQLYDESSAMRFQWDRVITHFEPECGRYPATCSLPVAPIPSPKSCIQKHTPS